MRMPISWEKKQKKENSQIVMPDSPSQSHMFHPNAAGIDVGATEIYVAVPEGRSEKTVRRFNTFTCDLYEAAKWLRECEVETIAMESTGVYWIPVFQILDDCGFEVILVNARHMKNVPGRKTDVQDCQWLQFLHSVGLLRGSFRPSQSVCAVRSILRHRDNLVKAASSSVQHMQKALTQMNLQIHNVISDITGTTGLAIIDAILAGQRDPKILAELKDPRIKAAKDTIRKSLTGDYHTEHVFTLKHALQTWRHYQQLIKDCDVEIEKYLITFDSRIDVNENPLKPSQKKRRKAGGNEPSFDLREHIYRILGTDLTLIDGISSLTAHVIFSEIGNDLSAFKNSGYFCSWLGLCPRNKITGGRIISSKTLFSSNRVAQALRISASTLWHSKSYLGDFFRRMRARHGSPKAITATAHKLARIIYHLIKNQKSYDEGVFAEQEKAHKEQLKKRVVRQARSLGLDVVPA